MERKEVTSFSFNKRNHGHWDVWINGIGRAFTVRGGPSAYVVIDQRSRYIDQNHKDEETREFMSLPMALAYLTDKLTFELIATVSQKVQRIEDWNL